MPTIDLSQLPPPDVVESLEFELIFTERKNALIAALPEELRGAIARTLALESEPLTKLLQENSYRELILRQRINEAARASMVAFAAGTDLDQLAANNNVKRLMLSAGDPNAVPPIPPVYESDADLRVRIPSAFEGLSVAGPVGSYEHHARSADGRVADASVISPAPAHVTVTVLSREGNGSAPADLIEKVDTALNDEDVRPVADRVTVQSAKIVNYEIDAVIYCYPSPEYEPITAAAEAQLKRYTTQQHRLGRDIVLSAIYAALHVQGVQRVEIKKPVADIKLDKTQASYCTNINVSLGGSDE
ncbi:baseplate assembly protein [Providencia stuartii]|uniref:baseplate assembly protein n=1 Tax=Providencia stuartii TaxID=588 RepID=UPI000DE77BC8|nr:baseplate assembly protein [Providencia stuartii]MDQ5989785.1 baseplate assembly protein [Providencia stuartii]RMA07999.1 baseplate assembly protein [Providencia stuartii]SST02772.1 phage-related baseplate assembly protein (GPJ-like) [Acinetobacter baumannii]